MCFEFLYVKHYLMQHLDENLHFLKSKISEIKFAIFKSEINSELQLPNNIIQVLQVDDEGQVWFLTSCKHNQKLEINPSFYAYLDFHKKGTDCKLQICGKAEIVEDQDESFLSKSNYSKSTVNQLLLIKMKIIQAEYFENKTAENISWKEKLKYTLSSMFYNPAHRVYDFT